MRSECRPRTVPNHHRKAVQSTIRFDDKVTFSHLWCSHSEYPASLKRQRPHSPSPMDPIETEPTVGPLTLTHQELTNPNLPDFADRFYFLTDSPQWTADKEELRLQVSQMAQSTNNPTLYYAFMAILATNVQHHQSPAELHSHWKSYLNRLDSSCL